MWTVQLPQELVEQILSFPPVMPLLRFRCVCKTWKSLIDSPTFAKSHFSKNPNSRIYIFSDVVDEYGSSGGPAPKTHVSYAEVNLLNCSHRIFFQSLRIPLCPISIQVLGSCDGFICFSTAILMDIVLVNLSTMECKLLPPISFSWRSYVVGFGYDCCADEYKVVVIPEEGSDVNIYGSKLNTWRQIAVSSKYNSYISPYYGKYVHGALHWIARDHELLFDLVTFDLVTETFTVVEYDRNLFGDPASLMLKVVGGQLCLLCCSYRGKQVKVDIWVMEEYGVKESWCKLVSFDRSVTPLAFSNCGRRLLFSVDYTWRCRCPVHWYDLDKKSMECIKTSKVSCYHACLQSLVRLEPLKLGLDLLVA